MDNKRLIEETIPLEDISLESAREKSIRHGHISTLHIWWARRPLVASRAAVFGSLVIPSKISKETLKKTGEITKRWLPEYKKIHITDEDLKDKELYHFMRVLCTWEASNNDEIINQAREIIKESHDGKSPKVLDPFAGGGSIPLEALRLGCDTYANELNPVAHIIELCTLVYPQKYGKWVDVEIEDDNKKNGQLSLDNDSVGKKTERVNKLAEDVQKWGNWVLEEVKKEIGRFYPTDPDGSIPVGYIWARTIPCQNPSCQTEIPLLRQLWLADTKARKISLVIVPDKQNKKIHFEISENINVKEFDPSVGTVVEASIYCPVCNSAIDGNTLRKLSVSKKMGERMIVVILHKPNSSQKNYRIANEEDQNMVKLAEKYLQKKVQDYKGGLSLIPDEQMNIHDPTTVAGRGYGIIYWYELFNYRQQISLALFYLSIQKAHKLMLNKSDSDYAKAVTTYLSCIHDRLVDYGNKFCTWGAPGEFAVHVFGRQALPMVWDYTEINPFSDSTGDWKGAQDWVVRVIENISKSNSMSANLILGSATNIKLENKRINAVITDPPYYDNVQYAELADFFFVWLKRSIGYLYPSVFKTPLSPKSKEIVQNPTRHSTTEEAKMFFEDLLTDSFKETYRVLQNDGVILVMYSHKSTSGWETLINSLLNSNLVTTASWPLHTERSGKMGHKTASLANSLSIVCKKQTGSSEGYYDEVKSELKNKIKNKLEGYWNTNIHGADFFISAIGPAVEVFGKYSKVKKLSGEEVSVAEFLNLVREEVTSYALEKILSEGNISGIDPETRFYILWRWAYDGVKVPFDDARILAQAIGAEIDELMSKTGVLKKSGENVELLGPFEIKVTKAETIIDVLHRSCQLWSQGKKQELANFLEESGRIKDGLFWSTAQAISEVLPDGDKEKQLLQGFLASRSGIAEAVKQGKLF